MSDQDRAMVLLADCILSIDGERIALSSPPAAADDSPPAHRSLRFGIPAGDVDRLRERVGQVGMIFTRAGVLMMRLRILQVDPAQQLLSGIPTPPDTV